LGSRVTVLAAIDVVELHPVSGVLECRIGILGVDAQDARALGHGDPVGRLTEALTRGGLALLLGSLEIPVSVEDRLSIPAVDSKRLQIAAEELPLTIAVQQVKAFGGRLGLWMAHPRRSSRRRGGPPRARSRGGTLALGLRPRPRRRSGPDGVARGPTTVSTSGSKAAATEPRASAFADPGQVVLAIRSGLIEDSPGTWPGAIWIGSRWT
jgi:hypothetical protein